jgi:uncharacterized repeat protein (TIGR03803 family)
MKTHLKLLLVPALIAGLGLIAAGEVTAQPAINPDGANPNAGLVLSGGTLYGTTATGGSWGGGTVFAINTNGTGFMLLHAFTGGSDGANPWAGLVVSGNTLYGVAYRGGSEGGGTVFAINSDGSGFTNLYSFASGPDGANPIGGLFLSGNTLYGTADLGGGSGNGTVFSLSFKPQLTVIPSATNVVVRWPTNYAGFDYTGYRLQSTTNLASSAWTTNLPGPVVISSMNTVTNPISGKQFFRLRQ